MFSRLPIPFTSLLRRIWLEIQDDDVLGLGAQLSYYFFLALFPAILFLLALASFFPLSNLTDEVSRALGPFVSRQVLELIQQQMVRLAQNENGGLLTLGVAGALWSSSAAMVSIASALNRAYDLEEQRPWWRVRLTAIALTLTVALLILIALSLVVAGPLAAAWLGQVTGWGRPFELLWLTVRWPIVFLMVVAGVELTYRLGPSRVLVDRTPQLCEAVRRWRFVSPGAVLATVLWVLASVAFKIYVANFADYEGAYGAVGGVIVVLLWLYVSGVAILVGAEVNAEIHNAHTGAAVAGLTSAASSSRPGSSSPSA